MRKNFPKCDMHIDCFANKKGRCVALTTTKSPGNICPFYKTKQEAEEARLKSRRRLVKIGREDLIEKYGGRITHEHKQI